jgi:N-acetylmuramoyl-L-alanine amidase
MKRLICLLCGLVTGLLSTVQVMALPADQRAIFDQGIYYFNAQLTQACSADSQGANVSSTLPSNIPQQYSSLLTQAATAYKANVQLMAAIFLSENGNTWKPFNTAWQSSHEGASGPWQFMPATWDGYKVDGNNDGVIDINNMYDATYSAAHLLSGYAGQNAPLGSLSTPFKANTLTEAAAAYNWGPGHVQEVGESASLSPPVPIETINYVKNVYTLISSGFTKSGNPNYGDPQSSVGSSDTKTTNGNSSTSEVGCACTTAASDTTGKPTIVLDPGHAGASTREVDPSSGIETQENGGAPGEMQNMWDSAQIIKSKLETAGYNVALTKNSEADTAGFVTKIARAEQAHPALVVSMHYTGGASFGAPNDHYGVTPQEVGRFRQNKDNGKRKTFTDDVLAQKSLQDAQIIAAERSKTGDKANVAPLDLSFPKDRGDVLAWGDISIVQLLSNVPWVYNETGSSGFDKQKYADGIANGIEKAVPVNGGGGSGSCFNGIVSGSIVSTAIGLSWPTPAEEATPPRDPNIATSAYKSAVQQYNPKAPFNGEDCGAFVSVVMRASGADPNYPLSGTSVQQDYVESHPGKYTIVKNAQSTADLKPGDILIVNEGAGTGTSGHTLIYIGPHGAYNEASASLQDRMPNLGNTSGNFSTGLMDSLGRGHYVVARLNQ